ncbi:MAG: hypothetical protein HQL81_01655 [Magnetococcales bacterium]|nr:hypothetical protein [Magnetococcales bacterium]
MPEDNSEIIPKSGVDQWIDSCKRFFDTGEDLVWFNMDRERKFGFITQNMLDRIERLLKSQKIIRTRRPAAMIKEFCDRDASLPFMGPPAIPTDTAKSLRFVTLVRASRLKETYDVDRAVVDEIHEKIASSQDNETVMESLVHKLNEGLQKYANLPESAPGGKQEVKSRRKEMNKLSYLLSAFEKFPTSFPQCSWITPAEPLLSEIQSKPLRSGQKVKRAIQLLGLKHDGDPECRFLVQFSIDPKYHSLIRKPTMLSNGDPQVYATWRNKSSPTRGYGRTVDLENLDVGLEEAVVPRPLVVAMANDIQVVGILLPADVIILNDVRTRPDLVRHISDNRERHFN